MNRLVIKISKKERQKIREKGESELNPSELDILNENLKKESYEDTPQKK